jgi:tetratricopeptide (TPR) repeat protein
MNSFRWALSALSIVFCLGSAQAQVRPEVGKPLQQAGELLKAGKSREALAKVREAEAVPGRTAQEQLTIDRMKAAAAQRAGDLGATIQALESIAGKVSGPELGQTAGMLASVYAQQRNNAKATEWLNKALQNGGDTAALKQLQAYLLSNSGDYAAIARDSAAAVSAAEQAGRKPAEDDLLRLADAYQRTGNTAGYTATLEKLLLHYRKKEYWAAYLGRLPRKPGFAADRYSLDLMRLKLATGNLSTTDEYMEMAQLALQAGLPTEGKQIVDKGYAANLLGTGTEAERHKRLRDLANKQEAETQAGLAAQEAAATAAKDGNGLVQVGMVYASMGQADKGVELIEKGIAKGGLKRPEDAKLRLGMAQMQSGKQKAKAVQTLRSVQGTDGAADLARLWAVLASQQ